MIQFLALAVLSLVLVAGGAAVAVDGQPVGFVMVALGVFNFALALLAMRKRM